MPEQFIIVAGDHILQPVGPFPSEEAAHAEYQRNQPRPSEGSRPYLTPPTIVRLLRPALSRSPSANLAESILRKSIAENGGCGTEDCGIAYLDSGWFNVTDEERAYLDALWQELDDAAAVSRLPDTPQAPTEAT